MKKQLLAIALLTGLLAAGQQRDSVPPGGGRGNAGAQTGAPAARAQGPKAYKDVITAKAITQKGLLRFIKWTTTFISKYPRISWDVRSSP